MDADTSSWLRARLLRRENVPYVVGTVTIGAGYSVVTQEGLAASAVAGLLWSLLLVGGYRHVTRFD